MLDYKPREELIALIQRQESELAKSHDQNETLKAEREAMALELAARQPLADSFVAPGVTVDTPKIVCYYLVDGDDHETNGVDQFSGGRTGGIPLVALPDALAHTARAVAAERQRMEAKWTEHEAAQRDLQAAAQPVAGELPPLPIGYSVTRVDGHGWYVDPPNGGRWVAHEGTPAADFIAALRQPVQQPAAVGNQHYESGRKQGRAEALAILMQIEPECGIDEYIGWRNSGAPEDEGSAYWNELKLRELFAVNGMLADMMDKAEGEYWRYLGMKDEAEHAKNFAANMHNSGKVREVLSKAGEFDLMGHLCSTAAVPAAGVQGSKFDISTPDRIRLFDLDGMLLNYRCAATDAKRDEFKAAIVAAFNALADHDKKQPDSGRDAALVELLREAAGVIARVPSMYGTMLRMRIDAALAHPAPSSDAAADEFPAASGPSPCIEDRDGIPMAICKVIHTKGGYGELRSLYRLINIWGAEQRATHPANGAQAGDADPIRKLIALHAEELDQNEYAYFELARTRRTDWMAWICTNLVDLDPSRKVLATGQGLTPDEACANAALDYASRAGAPQKKEG